MIWVGNVTSLPVMVNLVANALSSVNLLPLAMDILDILVSGTLTCVTLGGDVFNTGKRIQNETR